MKILIALDHNSSALRIAEAGYELAKALHAHTILLHVISDPTYYSSLNYSPILGYDSLSNLNTVETDTIEHLKRVAEGYLENMKLNLGGDMMETVIKEGDYTENILLTAKEVDADIIVMGTHSRKGLDKVLLGSVAENVLRRSTIPLFIIPVVAVEEK